MQPQIRVVQPQQPQQMMQQQQQPPPMQQQQRQRMMQPPPQQMQQAPPKQPPTQEEDSVTALTRELVKKFIADIWNRGEVDLIPEVCSPSLRFNGNAGFDRVGHEGLARMVGTIRDALDDYHCEIHSMVVENNKAFCRLRFTGKHTGTLLGFEPTHKVVAWMGATEFTCQNGVSASMRVCCETKLSTKSNLTSFLFYFLQKILKVWELGDVKTLEEQINPDLEEGDDF